jgi:hypothetical protein
LIRHLPEFAPVPSIIGTSGGTNEDALKVRGLPGLERAEWNDGPVPVLNALSLARISANLDNEKKPERTFAVMIRAPMQA